MLKKLRRQSPPSREERWQNPALARLASLPPTPGQAYRFIFVVGASGSGTTLLTRILSAPAGTVCLGGKYWTVPEADREAWQLMKLFNWIITILWDRRASLDDWQRARQALPTVLDAFLRQPAYAGHSHVIYKRSAPFNPGDQFRPDLHDLFALLPDVGVVAIYRDPCASTYSSWRRDFMPDLHQMAVVCEEQLTYLSAQLASLPPADRFVLPYEAFCRQPDAWLPGLADFCRLPSDALQAAAVQAQVTPAGHDKWQQELDPAGQQFLTQFFSERRRQQWPLLRSNA